MLAISSGSMRRCSSDWGRCSRMNARCASSHGRLGADQLVHEVLDARGVGRAGDHRVDRHAGAGHLLREAARDAEQRRLRHAVVDHLHG